jgi:GNAT superfamily N-acetyltransferase
MGQAEIAGRSSRQTDLRDMLAPMTTAPLSIRIRRANVEDAAGIGTVHVRAWQWAYRGHFPDSFLDTIDLARRTRWWRKTLVSDPAMAVFVAVEDDQVLGYCHVGPSRTEGPTIGELHSIYLLAHAAKRGIGRALMAAGLDTLQSIGFDEAMLWVLASNDATRRFYEMSGWYDDGGRHTYTLRDGIEAAAVRYRIKLGNAV